MVKPRSQKLTPVKKAIDSKSIDALADKMADKPYDKPIDDKPDQVVDDEILERVTITLPQTLKYTIDDLVIDRKRQKQPNRNFSAIVREALEAYLKNNHIS